MTKIIACGVVIIMMLTSAAAFAMDTHKAEDTIFDVIAVRPVGFVTLSIGAAFFAASMPLAVISGSTDKTAKALVADPFNYTFTRPLGDFDNSVPRLEGQNTR